MKSNKSTEPLVPDELVPELVKECTTTFLQLNSTELASQLTLRDFQVKCFFILLFVSFYSQLLCFLSQTLLSVAELISNCWGYFFSCFLSLRRFFSLKHSNYLSLSHSFPPISSITRFLTFVLILYPFLFLPSLFFSLLSLKLNTESDTAFS